MEFDPRAPEFRANPYPFYELLQTHAPFFYWETWGVWFLSRYKDCHTLLRDNRLGHAGDDTIIDPPPQQRPLFTMMQH